uniref:Uncharacterized protein n=1 Tax=Anguilla anguilla TaxID=7936 RepID=A0A0E9SZY0_ANGAN
MPKGIFPLWLSKKKPAYLG